MNRRMGWLVLAVALVAFVSGATGAWASIVADGGFESPVASGGAGTEYAATQTFGAWTVASGSVDLINSSGWTPEEGAQSVDMDGSTPGSIYQDLVTVPGQVYALSFWLAGNPTPGYSPIKTLQVSWGGAVVDTVTFDVSGYDGANMGWVEETCDVIALAGTTRLQFTSLDDPTSPCGPALDNVSVDPVPEPGTLVIWSLLGGLGITIGRRCRRKAA